MDSQVHETVHDRDGFLLFRCCAGCFHLWWRNRLMIRFTPAEILALLETLERCLDGSASATLPSKSPDFLVACRTERGGCRVLLWPGASLHLTAPELLLLCQVLRSARAVLDQVPEPEWRGAFVM